MRDTTRRKGANAATSAPAHPATRGAATSNAASSPSPSPRARKRSQKPSTDALTRLAGAVANSQRRNPSGDEDDAEFERNTAEAIARSVAQLADRTSTSAIDGPTAEQAYEFAKLLRAGVPQPDALCYVLGRVEAGVIDLALPAWVRSRAVVDALAALNGGRWPALEPDARLDIALDKHYAELAHYLYTHDYDSADGPTQRKLDTARVALEAQRTGRMQQNSPFARFLATLLKPEGQAAVAAGVVKALVQGERPSVSGMVDVEPIVDAEVTETAE